MLASITATVMRFGGARGLAEEDAQHVGAARESRGRPRRSRCAAIFIGGRTPKLAASVTATAAPVGVVSSTAGPRA